MAATLFNQSGTAMKNPGMDRLRQFISEDSPHRFEYCYDAADARDGEIILGAHCPAPPLGCVALAASDAGLADSVAHAGADQVACWAAVLARKSALRVRSHALTFDSALALLLLFARCGDDPDISGLQPWIAIADKGSAGAFHHVGAPERSAYWLLNALGHGYLVARGAEVDPTMFAAGMRAITRLLLDAVSADANPIDIVGRLAPTGELSEALAFHRVGQERYLRVIESGEVIQLLMPSVGGMRRTLVDALLASDRRSLGDIRSFALYDQVHPWRRDGFTLLASYQERAGDSPYRCFISVLDARLGVSLASLAKALQERETSKAAGLPGGAERATWSAEYGNTLVRVARGSPPTRLAWEEDIIATIWREFNPAVSLQVLPWLGPEAGLASRLEAISNVPRLEFSGKRFIAMRWYPPDDRDDLPECPTFDRMLVALLTSAAPGALPTPRALPPASSIVKLAIPGGFVLIHNAGVVLLDDWTKDEVEFSDYYAEFAKVCRRYEEIVTFGSKFAMEALARQLSTKGAKVTDGEFDAWVDSFAHMKLELGQVHSRTLARPVGASVLAFREALERSWGVGEQLRELTDAADQMQEGVDIQFKARHERAAFRWRRVQRAAAVAALALAVLLQVLPSFALPVLWRVVLIIVVVVGVFSVAWRFNRSRHRDVGDIPDVDPGAMKDGLDS